MDITKDILIALELAIKKAGTQEKFAKQCGVRRDFFSKCLNHKLKSISLDKWLCMAEYLDPFMPGYEERQKKWKDFISERQKHWLLTRICSYVHEDNNGERTGKIYDAIGKYIENSPMYIDLAGEGVDIQTSILRHPLLSVKKKEELLAELRKLEKEKVELLELKLQLAKK